MQRQSTIYALCDPASGEIRYIGKTVVPINIRLSQHYSQAMKGVRTHLHCWIRSLAARPTIRVLEVVPYEQDAETEVRLIAVYRAVGADLTNATDGGEGKKGCLHTDEAKAKIAAWNVGRKMPPKSAETLRRMADAQRGKKLSAEHRAKIGQGGMGRTATAETRAKLSAAKRGGKHTTEARANMSAAHKGKTLSEAHKASIAAGLARHYGA